MLNYCRFSATPNIVFSFAELDVKIEKSVLLSESRYEDFPDLQT